MSWSPRCPSAALLAAWLLLPGRLGAEEPDAGAPAADLGPAVPAPDAGPAEAPAADPAPRAMKEHLDRGIALYTEGKYDQAILAFTAAYALRPDPLLLFNIAQAHRKAGHAQEALNAYERFLREAPMTPQRAETEGYMTQLRTQLIAQLRREAPAPQEQRAVAPLPAPPPARPVYRRPWFWVVLGAAVASAATGIGLGVGLASSPRGPDTSLGNVTPKF